MQDVFEEKQPKKNRSQNKMATPKASSTQLQIVCATICCLPNERKLGTKILKKANVA